MFTVDSLLEAVDKAKIFGGRWSKKYDFVRDDLAKTIIFSPEGHPLHLFQDMSYAPRPE